MEKQIITSDETVVDAFDFRALIDIEILSVGGGDVLVCI